MDSQVEVYADPSGPTALPSYHQRRDYGVAEVLPFRIEGREIAAVPVRQLLP